MIGQVVSRLRGLLFRFRLPLPWQREGRAYPPR